MDKIQIQLYSFMLALVIALYTLIYAPIQKLQIKVAVLTNKVEIYHKK